MLIELYYFEFFNQTKEKKKKITENARSNLYI